MKKLLFLLFVILTSLLLVSALWSGYNYVFDNDELSHVHTVYLIAKGYQPFTSFFSIYSPLFHWMLIPLFWFRGFTLATIADARVVMTLLFLIRLVAAGFLVKELFGKRVAVLFLPIFLLDPFTVFSSMQIRPDNLMMTLYTFGLLILLLAAKRKDHRLAIIAGMLLGSAIITMIKISPSVVILLVLLALFHRKKDIQGTFLPFAGGLLVSFGVFVFYFLAHGSFMSMIQQVIFDGKLLNDSLLYPVTPGNFYWPTNVYLYGFSDRSLVWVYAQMFLVAGFAGAFQIFLRSFAETISVKTIIKLHLVISLAIHWLLLFYLRSVFLQYYLPISWLLAVGLAVMADDLLRIKYQNNAVRFAVILILTTTFLSVGKASIDLNLMRSSIDGHSEEARLEALVAKIPESKSVFPGFLFRPLVYPIPYGYYYGDMPASVITRFSPVHEVLNTKNVNFIVATETYLSYLPNDTQQYIKEHFVRDMVLQELWIRKSE